MREAGLVTAFHPDPQYVTECVEASQYHEDVVAFGVCNRPRTAFALLFLFCSVNARFDSESSVSMDKRH